MKLQELLRGPQPSPSPMPRGSRDAGADARASFAGALSEARRKPEPKPAETEAPAAKKPASTKKKDGGATDAAPADDTVATEPAAAVDTQASAAASDENEPVATDEEAVADADDSQDGEESAASEHDELAEQAALALISGAPSPAPAELTNDVVDGDVDETSHATRPICPMPKDTRPVATPASELAEGEAGVQEAAGLSQEVAATVLEGFDLIDEPVTGEVGAAPTAKAPAAPVAQPAASPVVPVGGDALQGESKAGDESHHQRPEQAGELPFAEVAADGELIGEEPIASPVGTTAAPDGTSATAAAAHIASDAAKTQSTPAASAAPAPAPMPPQIHFAETNHPKIVTAVQAQALTNGGSMQIRLDPPELGALQVLVHMQDGVMTASFQTSNDDATRMLSHSLSQLKQVLEASGVSVEKLQVQQAPKDQQASNQGEDRQQQRDQNDDAHRQEQQRKEMLRRMWRRLSNGSDPLDMVA